MPRPSNTDERREQITQAMLRVVAKQGYAGASMADIAREAKLSQGLLHYHFASKHDLLLSLQDRISKHHLTRLHRWLSRGKTPLQRIGAFLDCHLARDAEEDPEAIAAWITLTAEALRDTTVREQYALSVKRFLALLEDEIREVQKTKTLPNAQTPDALATAIFAVIEGYYALHGACPGVIPRGSAVECVRAMTAGLLGVSPDFLVLPANE